MERLYRCSVKDKADFLWVSRQKGKDATGLRSDKRAYLERLLELENRLPKGQVSQP